MKTDPRNREELLFLRKNRSRTVGIKICFSFLEKHRRQRSEEENQKKTCR